MSSTATPRSGPATVPELCAAVDLVQQLVDSIAAALADPARLDLGAVPTDVVAELTTTMLTISDRSSAVATVAAGHVTAVAGPGTGALIAGRYASARRWLEIDAGLAPASAKAVLARARDLREHSGPVQRAWLAGAVSGDSVRELTSGVSAVLKMLATTRQEKERLRAEALDVLLPVAVAGTPADTRRVVARLRLLAGSACEEQARMEAYDEQSLSCIQVGDLSRITAWLTHENAAAVMTVIDQHARRIADRDPDVSHDPTCPLAIAPAPGTSTARRCGCGASAGAGLASKDRWPHLRAVALGELAHDLLDDGRAGTHHGVAPHVTLTVDLDRLQAGLGGDLTMPGTDEPIVLGSATVRRILCDSDVTPVIVARPGPSDHATPHEADADDAAGTRSGHVDQRGGDGDVDPVRRAELVRLLLSTAVTVLHVGRSQRTVTPRQRRALEVRDRHCIFPGCHAHPRRCHAHHVLEWENGGSTDIVNLALLCVRHHHSVHEGGWTISRAPGTTPYETGCWTLDPPRLRP